MNVLHSVCVYLSLSVCLSVFMCMWVRMCVHVRVCVCVCVCVCHRCDSIVPFSGLPNDDEEYFATSENDSDKVASKRVAAKSKSSKSTFSKVRKSQPLFKGT